MKNEFDLLHTVHEAEKQNLKPIPPAHNFEVTLEPDTFTEEKFCLYKEYQINVHHDKPEELKPTGFKRFLCGSPLRRCTRQENGKEQQLGSFHQCYRLDGRLIAIGVLDLLPHAVSGVYFIYHPDFEKWSFGKLSAMREAALALEGGYEYYYMGYYIHNCTKMRYKGDYKPQYVLDPETYEWNALDGELRQLLDQKKYVSLSREHKSSSPGTENGDQDSEYPFPLPKEAADTGMSLLSLGMPGVPNAAELKKQVDLDDMQLLIGSDRGRKRIANASVSTACWRMWLKLPFLTMVPGPSGLGRGRCPQQLVSQGFVCRIRGMCWARGSKGGHCGFLSSVSSYSRN